MDFTVNFGTINLLLVFAATIAGNLLGGLWYSPFLFGKIWAKANNIELGATGIPNAPMTFAVSFVLQLFVAAMIAALLGNASSVDGAEGAELGALMAFSFVLPAMGITNLFERRQVRIIAINTAFHLASFTLMGFIIGNWS